MSKPVLLDLFCRKGGATVGYQRAGFHVIGVDIEPQPGYPGDEFIQADVLEYLLKSDDPRIFYAAVRHASPPCQEGNAANIGSNAARGNEHPQLVPPTRALLEKVGLPYVIEQPTSSRKGLIRRDVTLCMDMFKGAMPPPWVQKHRSFELGGMEYEDLLSIKAAQPRHSKHEGYVYGHRHGVKRTENAPYVAAYGKGGGKATGPQIAHAQQIDWMWTDSADPKVRDRERFDLCEAIPPAYTEWLGRQFLEVPR